MGIATIITLILSTLTSSLGTEGVISSGLASLITKLAGTVPNLVAALIAGKHSITDETLAVLQGIQDEINTLRDSTTLLTQNQENEINALSAGIADAIIAYKNSLVTTDPSNLTPLPEKL